MLCHDENIEDIGESQINVNLLHHTVMVFITNRPTCKVGAIIRAVRQPGSQTSWCSVTILVFEERSVYTDYGS